MVAGPRRPACILGLVPPTLAHLPRWLPRGSRGRRNATGGGLTMGRESSASRVPEPPPSSAAFDGPLTARPARPHRPFAPTSRTTPANSSLSTPQSPRDDTPAKPAKRPTAPPVFATPQSPKHPQSIFPTPCEPPCENASIDSPAPAHSDWTIPDRLLT